MSEFAITPAMRTAKPGRAVCRTGRKFSNHTGSERILIAEMADSEPLVWFFRYGRWRFKVWSEMTKRDQQIALRKADDPWNVRERAAQYQRSRAAIIRLREIRVAALSRACNVENGVSLLFRDSAIEPGALTIAANHAA